MAILLIGNEVSMTIPAGVTVGSGSDVRTDKGTGSVLDSDYVRGTTKYGQTSVGATWDLFENPAYDDTQTVWFHVSFFTGLSRDIASLQIVDGSGDKIYAIEVDSSFSGTTLRAHSYNDAGTETTVSQVATATQSVDDLDWCFDIANDLVYFYQNDSLVGSLTLDLNQRTAATTMVQLEYLGGATSDLAGQSQMIVTTNEPTLGWKVKHINPDGAGNHTAWTGAFTTVNENLYDPATETTIVGAGSNSYTYDDVQAGIQTGMEIRGVLVATVATADVAATAPSVQNLTRLSAVDYSLGTAVNVESGDNRSAIVDWELVNPGTSAAWTFTEINAAEFGYTSS